MENLFLTILSISLTTSIIIIALILLGSLINKRYVAKWKYGLWVALALRLLIPFNYTVPDSDFQITVPDEVGSMTVSDIFETGDEVVTAQPANYEDMAPKSAEPQTIAPQPTEPGIQPKARSSFSVMQALSYLWAAGAACLLIWQLTGYFYCKRRILKRGKPAESSILSEQLHELCRELGIRKGVSLLIYENAFSPMIIGFWNPVLVLPCNEYTPQESYYILKHELIHLRRHDIPVKFLLMLARDVHWFNPIIYLMQREAVVDMELACDEAVVRGSSYDQREAYTETLMSILHGKQRRGPILSTQFSGGVRIMKKRFRNILSKANKKNGAVLFSAILIMTVIVGTMVGCSIEQPIPEILGTEISGQNTVGDALLSMNAGAEGLLNLSAGGEELSNSQAIGVNDTPTEEDAAAEITREPATILTLIKEGMEEEESATLYIGNGYSFYLIDDQWVMTAPGSWYAKINENVRFRIDKYEGLTQNQVEEMLTEQGYAGDEGSSGSLYKYERDTDTMNRVLCYETDSGVWTMNSVHSLEGEEGWRVNIRAMFDTFAVTEGYEGGPYDIVLTDGHKSLLQTMCYYMPNFNEPLIMEDEHFWSTFIYRSFTDMPMEYGKYKPIYGEGESVMVYREDWGIEEPVFKISEKYVREYVRLILGVEMPEVRPAFEDVKENQAFFAYRDGYYYIEGSDFGEEEYRFRDLEVSNEQYNTSAIASYDLLTRDDNGEWEVTGTVQFHLNYADNANGFVIAGKEVDWY